MIYLSVGTCNIMQGVRDGVIHLGRVHSILKILQIQIGLIIIHTFLTMQKLILRSRIPNVFMVNHWNTKTPKDFKFTAKFPKVITHKKRLNDVDKELDHFFQAMGRLSQYSQACTNWREGAFPQKVWGTDKTSNSYLGEIQLRAYNKSSVIEQHTITHIFQIPYPKEIVVQRATLDLYRKNQLN